jgi:hypothetical protein
MRPAAFCNGGFFGVKSFKRVFYADSSRLPVGIFLLDKQFGDVIST